jgi:hypothetical protein
MKRMHAISRGCTTVRFYHSKHGREARTCTGCATFDICVAVAACEAYLLILWVERQPIAIGSRKWLHVHDADYVGSHEPFVDVVVREAG